MIEALTQALLHVLADLGGVGEEVTLRVDVEHLGSHRRADRMARVGIAVAEDADLPGCLGDRLDDLFGHDDGTDRQIGRRERLGEAHRVRLDAEGLGPERIARAPEATDHFIGDEEDVVLLQDRLDRLEVAARRDDDATGALHGLGDERRHRVRILFQDQRLEFGGEAHDELGLGLTWLREAAVMRRRDVVDPVHRQIEVRVERRQAGKRA